MAKHDEFIIDKREDGRWQAKKPHAERASFVDDRQSDVIARARKSAPEGDIKVKGENGKFRHLSKG